MHWASLWVWVKGTFTNTQSTHFRNSTPFTLIPLCFTREKTIFSKVSINQPGGFNLSKENKLLQFSVNINISNALSQIFNKFLTSNKLFCDIKQVRWFLFVQLMLSKLPNIPLYLGTLASLCSSVWKLAPCNFSLVFTTHNGVVTNTLITPKNIKKNLDFWPIRFLYSFISKSSNLHACNIIISWILELSFFLALIYVFLYLVTRSIATKDFQEPVVLTSLSSFAGWKNPTKKPCN